MIGAVVGLAMISGIEIYGPGTSRIMPYASSRTGVPRKTTFHLYVPHKKSEAKKGGSVTVEMTERVIKFIMPCHASLITSQCTTALAICHHSISEILQNPQLSFDHHFPK